MGCPPVRGDNPRALASGLSYVQVDNHGTTIYTTYISVGHFVLKLVRMIIGPRRKNTCLRGIANNKSADQPAHPRSLISAFDIHLLESIICKLATGEISIF